MTINSIPVNESDGSKPIPEGLYKAFVKEIKEGTGEFGDYVKIALEITEGEYEGVIKTMIASLKLSKSKNGKNSKLFDVVKAVLKTEPKPGESLDLTELIGKTCHILVVDGKEIDGNKYQNVGKILPE